MSKATCFIGDPFEYVVYKAVHDRHGLAGDARVGMNLTQDLVDVDGITITTLALLLLVCLRGLSLARPLGSFTRDFRSHDNVNDNVFQEVKGIGLPMGGNCSPLLADFFYYTVNLYT